MPVFSKAVARWQIAFLNGRHRNFLIFEVLQVHNLFSVFFFLEEKYRLAVYSYPLPGYIGNLGKQTNNCKLHTNSYVDNLMLSKSR